ncbi:hypothetical protein KAI32_00135 [Candidatus Pacearchaeota archaeon]|nr:hypothetical protein [Candidatus Pacearchaeota archaeon]
MKEGVKSKIPKLKKKISAFLVGEEGKISKNSLLKIGGVLTGLSSATIVAGVNNLHLSYTDSTATAKHGNHSSHSQHGSHSSY